MINVILDKSPKDKISMNLPKNVPGVERTIEFEKGKEVPISDERFAHSLLNSKGAYRFVTKDKIEHTPEERVVETVRMKSERAKAPFTLHIPARYYGVPKDIQVKPGEWFEVAKEYAEDATKGVSPRGWVIDGRSLRGAEKSAEDEEVSKETPKVKPKASNKK